MRRLVLFVALVFALPASGQQTPLMISATRPVVATENPEYTKRGGRQDLLGVTATSRGWVVLWADVTGMIEQQWTVFASRIEKEGSLIDPTGIPLFVSKPTSFAAVRDGDGARLYWSRFDETSSSFEILSRTFSWEGVVSSEEVLAHIPRESPGGTLRAAQSGSRTLLVFGRYLLVVEGAQLLRMTDLGGWGDPSTIAIGGNRALVTWSAAGGILMYQIVSIDGDVLGAAGGAGLASGVFTAASAGGDTGVLLAYPTQQALEIKRFDLESGTYSDAGRFIDASGQPLVIWNGSRFIVAWGMDGQQLVGVDVSADGLAQGPPRELVHGAGYSLAAVADRILITDQRGYCIRFGCDYDVWYSMLPLEAVSAAEAPTLVTVQARPQQTPAMAKLGNGYFGIWMENDYDRRLFGGLITRSSQASPIPITPANETSTSNAAIVSAGDRALILTIGGPDLSQPMLRGRFVDANGNLTVLTGTVRTGTIATALSAATSGSIFLATWRQNNGEIRAVRLAPNGEPVDSVPMLLGSYSNAIVVDRTAVAFDGSDFIVVWADLDLEGLPSSYVIRAVRVSPGGSVTPLAPLVSTSDSILDPSIACGGGNCLLAWEEWPPEESNVEGLLFGSNSPAARFRIAGDAERQSEVKVAWEGDAFFLTWSARIDSETVEKRATTVKPATAPVIARPITIGLTDFSSDSSALACIDGEGCAVLYQAVTNDRLHGQSARLFKSFLAKSRPRGVRRLQ